MKSSWLALSLIFFPPASGFSNVILKVHQISIIIQLLDLIQILPKIGHINLERDCYGIFSLKEFTLAVLILSNKEKYKIFQYLPILMYLCMLIFLVLTYYVCLTLNGILIRISML